MTAINRRPGGLLGFLGIKNFGRDPTGLSEVLIPTWDLATLYLNSAPRYAELTVAGAVAGSRITHAPPQGEMWFVSNFSIRVISTAASAWNGSVCRFGQLQTEQVLLSDSLSLGASVSGNKIAQGCPTYLAPGEGIGYFTNDVAGTVNVVAQVRYVPLPI